MSDVKRCPNISGRTCDCVSGKCNAWYTPREVTIEDVIKMQQIIADPRIITHMDNKPNMEVYPQNENSNHAVLGATKYDEGKPDMSLLSPYFIEEVTRVLDFGKRKYAAHNWRLGFVWSRPASAALRHIFSWLKGEDNDPESGLSHLAHAACCLMFLVEFVKTKNGTDDRYKRK